jgi:H+/gluconate symporter-like permease
MALGIIFTALFASAFGIMYMYFTTRNRERMAMIEKGESIELFTKTATKEKPKRNYSAIKFTLKFGLFLIGIGIGFIFTVFFGQEFEEELRALFAVGSAFICGGLGLVAGYLIGRLIDKRDKIR